MRKAQLNAEIARLKELNATLTRDRDGLLRDVHDAVGSLRADVGGLKDKVFDQSKALTKVGSDLGKHTEALASQGTALAKHGDAVASLEQAVQASLLAGAEDKAAAQPEVTPIAAKRSSKATG